MIIRQINPNDDVGETLKKVPLFASLNKQERAKLGGALKEHEFPPGDVVFSEGDEGDKFYVIKSGHALVLQQTTGGQVCVCSLGSGDYFGEQAIVTDGHRNATIKAGDNAPLKTWMLDRNIFKVLFKEDRLKVIFADRRRLAVTGAYESKYSPENGEPEEEEPLQPQELPQEVEDMLMTAIHGSLLFATLDDDHKKLIARLMYKEEVPNGETVIVEGEEGDKFYVVESGEFDVFQKDRDELDHLKKKVDHKSPGDHFGDLALLYDAPRNATVTAITPSTVRALDRKVFARVCRQIGESRLKAYTDFLAKVEVLQPLANSERMKLAETLDLVEVQQGATLCQQGEPGDCMFLLVTGQVTFSVLDKETGKEKIIDGNNGTITAGGYFGERALLHDEPRKCTAVATLPSRLLRVEKKAFEMLLGPLKNIMKQSEGRYSQTSQDNIQNNAKTWVPVETKLGELKIQGVLGRGSYGFVQLVIAPDGTQYALKAVSKQRIVDTHQKKHIYNEKNIMSQCNHPFLVRLAGTYVDQDFLYFLLEPSLGGELYRVLKGQIAFNPKQAMFYAGSVILGFEYLHKKCILFRDLKPENLLLGADGYLKITDFGFCKVVKHKTWTMCGTPEYMAPEVIQNKGHGKGVDWWCVGILTYEMLSSHSPFYGRGDIMDLYARIIKNEYRYPPHVTPDARDLIDQFLKPKPTHRLGVIKGGADKIKSQRWFNPLDWEALLWKKLPAPYVPSSASISKLSNFAKNARQVKVAPYVDDGSGWDKEF